MNPVQKVNDHFIEGSFLQKMPSDVLSEIGSHLAHEQLGTLASVCQLFNTCEISNAMWKSLVYKQLPQAYQKLPGIILKEKFKCYREFLKNKVNLVLENAQRTTRNTSRMQEPLFSDKLIQQLNDKEICLIKKCAFITADWQLKSTLMDVYFFALHGANDSVFELLLQVYDVNNPLDHGTYPLLFDAMGKGNIKIAKKLIDAGADLNRPFNGLSIAEYLQQKADTQSASFPQELYDEVANYAAQR